MCGTDRPRVDHVAGESLGILSCSLYTTMPSGPSVAAIIMLLSHHSDHTPSEIRCSPCFSHESLSVPDVVDRAWLRYHISNLA